jgi:multiple sugar transport system substrate-binding protein
MGMTRRRMIGGLPVAAGGGAASLLAACGAAGGTPAAPTPVAKTAKVLVRAGSSQPLVDLFDQKLLPAYKQQTPQHTVTMEWLPGAGAPAVVESLTTAKAAGTDPDLFFIGYNWIASLALNKLAGDMTKYVKTWAQEKDYYAGTIQPAWGKTWHLPWLTACDLYLYRTDWFSEAGLATDAAQFPTTWEAYSDAVTKLTRRSADEITRAGVEGALDFREWRALFWQTGQDEWNADQSKMTFNNQSGVDALSYVYDLQVKRSVSPLTGMKLPSGAANAFASGLAAIQRLNPRTANLVKTGAPDVWAKTAIGAPHKRTKQFTHVDNDGWALAYSAKEPEAAFSFLSFLSAPPQMLAYGELQGSIPPRKSLGTSAHMQQPHLKVFADAIDKYGHAYRLDVNHSPVLKAMVDDVMAGKKAPKQALDDAVAEINRTLEQLPPAPK